MNDTLIFLVLAGLALIFKWLTSQGSSDSEKPEPPAPNESPSRRPPPESDEERVRRFLEALGMPQGTQPPPPVQRRRVVTPTPAPAEKPRVKRSWVQPLPPIVTTPPELLPPPLPSEPVPEVIVRREEVVAPPPVPVPLMQKPVSRRPASVTSLGAMLRSRASIRRAIILREVLGPPRGLQAFDDLRSF
jgi:hypothetical protein